MSVSDWIITIAGSVITLLIAVSAFFIAKWIGNVDEAIKELTKGFYNLSHEVSTLSKAQDSATENIPERICENIAQLKIPGEQIDKIENEIVGLKNVIQRKILPQLDEQSKVLGKVTVLETNFNSLISGLKARSQQKPQGQK